MQSLFSNNSESLVLGELGANSLRFLGPNRGLLPIGPNSIPGLNTLQPSPLTDAGTYPAILSYNYTLNHQGITSHISCIYDTQSPITYSAGPADLLGNVTASCNGTGLHDPFPHSRGSYQMPNTNSTLAFWACSNGQKYATYYIYFHGCSETYEKEIGNITCSVSPIQPAVFPVTYQRSTHVFSTLEEITTSAAPSDFFSMVIEWGMVAFVNLVQVAQNPVHNLVAASVKELGIQALGIQPPNDLYLSLYEAMLKGTMVDLVCTANDSSLPLLMVILQVTYQRFLYSTITDPPPPASCIRRVNGTLSAEVTGWVAKQEHIGFLIPMTIINLASFITMSISIARAKRSSHQFDLTDPRSLVLAESRLHQSEPSGWADGVSYRSREVRGCHI